MTGQFGKVLLAFGVLLGARVAHAEDALLAIKMAGEAYDGAPKFQLLADKQVIGAGELAKAVDTATGNRLKAGKRLRPDAAESFLFAVPNIETVSQFEIEFTNDAWAGKGKPGDRNLYVLGLSLSVVKKTATGAVAEIRDFTPDRLTASTRNPGGADITPHYSALFQNGRLRLARPQGGWAGSASVAAPPPPQAAAPQTATTTPCRHRQIEIKGFGKNVTTLSPAMLEQLTTASKALGNTSCSARITAYAAGGPSSAFRTTLALARAEAVAEELTRLGLARDRIKTGTGTGGGRRVTISFE